MAMSKRFGLGGRDIAALESLVERHGMKRIVTQLASIAEDYVEDTSDDREISNSWARDSRALDSCAAKLED